MSFVANDNQQLTLTDSTFNLTQREKRVLEKSWANTFAEKVFPAIDESIFSVLYSDKASRPNTPVNVIVALSNDSNTAPSSMFHDAVIAGAGNGYTPHVPFASVAVPPLRGSNEKSLDNVKRLCSPSYLRLAIPQAPVMLLMLSDTLKIESEVPAGATTSHTPFSASTLVIVVPVVVPPIEIPRLTGLNLPPVEAFPNITDALKTL